MFVALLFVCSFWGIKTEWFWVCYFVECWRLKNHLILCFVLSLSLFYPIVNVKQGATLVNRISKYSSPIIIIDAEGSNVSNYRDLTRISLHNSTRDATSSIKLYWNKLIQMPVLGPDESWESDETSFNGNASLEDTILLNVIKLYPT